MKMSVLGCMTDPFGIRKQFHHAPEADGGLPSRVSPESRGIAYSGYRTSAEKCLVLDDVIAPIEVDAPEGDFRELLDSVRFAGRDDIVSGRIVSDHANHRVDEVRCITPVRLRRQVANHQLLLRTLFDTRSGTDNFLR